MRDLFLSRDRQQAEAADDETVGDLFNEDVPADRIEWVQLRTIGWKDRGSESMERSHVGRIGDVACDISAPRIDNQFGPLHGTCPNYALHTRFRVRSSEDAVVAYLASAALKSVAVCPAGNPRA